MASRPLPFRQKDVIRLIKAARAAGEVPECVWVQYPDGTRLEVKLKDAESKVEVQVREGDTWSDVA